MEYVKEEAKMVYLLECLQKTPPPVRTSICWDGFKYQKTNHSELQQTKKNSTVGRCSYLQRRKLMWTLFMSTCCWKEWRQWPSMEGKVRKPDDAMTMLLGSMCNCISSPVDVSLLPTIDHTTLYEPQLCDVVSGLETHFHRICDFDFFLV